MEIFFFLLLYEEEGKKSEMTLLMPRHCSRTGGAAAGKLVLARETAGGTQHKATSLIDCTTTVRSVNS